MSGNRATVFFRQLGEQTFNKAVNDGQFLKRRYAIVKNCLIVCICIFVTEAVIVALHWDKLRYAFKANNIPIDTDPHAFKTTNIPRDAGLVVRWGKTSQKLPKKVTGDWSGDQETGFGRIEFFDANDQPKGNYIGEIVNSQFSDRYDFRKILHL